MSVRHALLALLADGPRHGYQLRLDFEAATGHLWPLNVGQVYSTIDRLIRDQLVEELDAETEDGGPQRRYGLTRAGSDVLEAWWDAAPVSEPPPRDELAVKVLVALGGADPELALRVVTTQRSAVTAALQHGRQRKRRDAGANRASAAADELVLARAEADLRWLDLCEQRLLADAPAARGDRRARSARAPKVGERTR
jgi:DNA-binding PadR family transcriptional regulator